MNVVEPTDWLLARLDLLEKEKALTQLREDVAAARRGLPWTQVKPDYCFTDETGSYRLRELFAGRSQLVVYHFMYGPGWQEGCKSCSFWADQYDAMSAHLAARDVSLAVISSAPWPDFQAFKQRMGWQFQWLSSNGTSFNEDFGVSFPNQNEGVYNYQRTKVMAEMPGVSVFATNADDDQVFHTYSAYARGLDALNATYQILDLVPRGRDESELPFPMHWVRLHDQYD